jgi:hypothetical protein
MPTPQASCSNLGSYRECVFVIAFAHGATLTHLDYNEILVDVGTYAGRVNAQRANVLVVEQAASDW